MAKKHSKSLRNPEDELIISRLVGICGLGFSLIYATAIFSFNAADPSFLASSHPIRKTTNLAGWFGANLSSMSFFAVGIVGYLIPLVLVSLFLGNLRQHKKLRLRQVLGFVLMLTAVCTICQQLLDYFRFSASHFGNGGVVGNFLANKGIKAMGFAGNLMFWLTAFASAAVLMNPRTLSRFGAYNLATLQLKMMAFVSGLSNQIKGLFRRRTMVPESASLIRLDNVCIETVSQPDVAIEKLASKPKIKLRTDEPAKALPKKPTSQPASYRPPAENFFKASKSNPNSKESEAELEKRSQQIVAAFQDFGVTGQVTSIQPGPVVTVFEFEPDAGTKLSRILSLIDDIAMALRVESVFIFPAKGKRAIAVQVPNTRRETVYLGDIIRSSTFLDAESPLTIAMGKSLSGEPVCADLATMPHLLTAGATGSGKSVAINALLSSMIAKSSPEQIRMILVDPKMLELSVYEGIPHLLMPVITDPSKASLALKWATYEMERRYRLMQIARVRHISGFNQHWSQADEAERARIKGEMNDDSITALPFIVLVIDELADLMLTAPKDVETSIQRLAQKARASGIHLVLATQRPSVDIITGVIKANLPCRIAFQTVSRHDSRTILDQIGSDKLLGKGDMLFMRPGTSRLERIQGAFVQDDEVLNFIEWIKSQYPARYDEKIMHWIDREFDAQRDESNAGSVSEGIDDDPVFDQATAIASSMGQISASYLQRQLKIGYNRAARIVETMEARGLVSKADGAKPRQWLGNSL
jgi:S-DNA-T family DNA segregation ATPase FtsK/SpoIIIE